MGGGAKYVNPGILAVQKRQYKRNISFLTQMKRKIFAIDSCVRFEDAMEN